MALYVRLMVYTGLSLLIIRRANVYLVVCVLTRITLHSSRMRTDYTVTKPSSEPVGMRPIVHRQTSLAVGKNPV